MGKLAYAALAAAWIGGCGIASATDLTVKDPPQIDPPQYDTYPIARWAGPYIGGHVGGAMGRFDITDTYDYHGDPTAKNRVKSSGVLGGAQVGYNFQRGSLVYGVEADFGWLDVSGRKSAALPVAGVYGLNGTYSSSGGAYGDLTSRVGYARDRSLFYLKGGVALLDADFKAHYDGENCSTRTSNCYHWTAPNRSRFDHSQSDTMIGWTVGAGFEYALTSSWSLKAEYQHFDFGRRSYSYDDKYTFNTATGYHSHLTGHTEIDTTADAVTLGVNYRIGGYGGAMK